MNGPVAVDGPVVAGFDGSPESLAATAWAAREALRRGLALELLQAWPWPKRDSVGTNEVYNRSRDALAAREAELRATHAGLQVSSRQVPDDPAKALVTAGRTSAVLVLGSRGLGPVRGFLVGSVSQEVLRRATCPVVLVRAGEGEQGAATDPVLVGVDLAHPPDDVLAFAFEAAAHRSAPLRIVHVWAPPAGSEYMAFDAIGGLEKELSASERKQFADVLALWLARYPQVTVTSELVRGNAAIVLVEASETARLVVLGRHVRRLPLGAHLGPVAHAAIHHVRCPVAVVPDA
ncbi:universal stress protein [Kitasatospora sp. NPDC056731]|uniref:universal stress protein n=1 Tax=Kitasatospora sp. NPDC056731 TaxID=3155422 RepID=UPI0034227645